MTTFHSSLGPAVLGLLSDCRDNPVATSDIVTHLLCYHEHACSQLTGDSDFDSLRQSIRPMLMTYLMSEPRARAVEIPIDSTFYAVKAWQWKA